MSQLILTDFHLRPSKPSALKEKKSSANRRFKPMRTVREKKSRNFPTTPPLRREPHIRRDILYVFIESILTALTAQDRGFEPIDTSVTQFVLKKDRSATRVCPH